MTAAIEKEVKAEEELLQGLSKKIFAEGKTEEDLYEKFVCWGDCVVSAKTASNADAEAGMDELEAYIEDVKAGKVEFTCERTDLETPIAGLKSDIEAAQAQRRQEKAGFLAARDEMQKGIKALETVFRVLSDATDNMVSEEATLKDDQLLLEGPHCAV